MAIVPFGWPATAVHEVPPFVDIHNDCPEVLFTPTKILWVALPAVELDLSNMTKLTFAVVLKDVTCDHEAP